VFEKTIDEDRQRQGWRFPTLDAVATAQFASEHDVAALVASAPIDSIHICDGIRGNPLLQYAQERLWSRRLQQWVTMETVDDSGALGVAKRLEYSRRFRKWRGRLQGVLAIGMDTPEWVISRGMSYARTFPFAYFLEHATLPQDRPMQGVDSYKLAFVGQLIERKRLDLLIRALARLQSRDFVLSVVGSGADEPQLRKLARVALPGRVEWVGGLPIDEVPELLSQMDCLVLPSRHDGWGAVVSEAMMVGTPAICSDKCGSYGVVKASGYGDVFRSDDLEGLAATLDRAIQRGRVTYEQRTSLAAWARCLGAHEGAEYFLRILEHIDGKQERPQPPWMVVHTCTEREGTSVSAEVDT
jgi:glycosyltransferase involved in cell wall biosynthesis